MTNKQFAVLGLGRFGQSIVKTLCEAGCDVLACDIDPHVVQEMSHFATHVVQVDVRDDGALASLGLRNFDVVIIAISGDNESSIMATLAIAELGVPYIVAKAHNVMQKKILERVGAHRVVLPEREMGVRLANNLISSNVLDYINLSDEFSIAEIEPLDKWEGKALKNTDIRSEYGLNVVAIKRGKKMLVSTKPSDIISKGDLLVVIGQTSDIQDFQSN